MYAQLELLIQLQELDQEAARLQHKLAEILPQIEESRIHLREAEQVLETGRARVETIKKDRRQAERELDAHIEKRRKFQDQQGKVKTNKEYQALMGELEAIKREETAFEDRILVLMEEQSEIEKDLPGLIAEVTREKTTFQEKERVLRQAETSLREALAVVEAQRAEVVSTLEREPLLAYQRVQKLRGTAVAEVRDELCFGCRMNLPPQKYVEIIRNDSIQNCPNCHRILFHRKPEVAAGPGA